MYDDKQINVEASCVILLLQFKLLDDFKADKL
jgi:hypothetical protein